MFVFFHNWTQISSKYSSKYEVDVAYVVMERTCGCCQEQIDFTEKLKFLNMFESGLLEAEGK